MKAGTNLVLGLLIASAALLQAAPVTAADSRSLLEDDWLFQAGGRPTLQHCKRQIASAGLLAKRLARSTKAPDIRGDLADLRDLDKQLGALGDNSRGSEVIKLYLAIRRVKRRIVLKNPAVNFTQVLLVDNPYPSGREWPHQSRHRNNFMANSAGRLIVAGLNPDGPSRSLVSAGRGGFFWRPDLSFDGKKILYCCKRLSTDWALQLLASPRGNNIITQNNALSANDKGVSYTVAFDIGPTVWATANQATAGGDKILIELVNSSGKTVASHLAESGQWRGSQTFAPGGFTYTGDGSGKVRFRLSPADKSNSDHFYGVVDNLKVTAGKTVAFFDNFNAVSQGGSGRQNRTGLPLVHSANLAGWSASGLNAFHAVQRPGGSKRDLAFHLFEINADGTGLKQLTFGDFDDLDPIYLPDGRIMFSTTRGHTYVRCGPDFPAYILARCDADGKNIYIISQNSEPDYLPSLLADGRVVFSRWEYTDKEQKRVQSLWTVNPDGTNVTAFWGNQSVWPDHLAEPRAIPGSRRVMFVGVGHHQWFNGSIGIVDPSKGLNYPKGLTKVTPDLPWAEVGDGPTPAPKENADYRAAGKFTAYKTPYPLSEEDFLVSAKRGGKFNLYLMDVSGNRELIYVARCNAWHAMPFIPRKKPPVLRDAVAWPGTGKNHKPAKNGVFLSSNVFQGAPLLPKDKVKYLRVIQSDARTYTTWHKTYQTAGPAISATQADSVKRILGTVPVESDGSVCFEAPPGKALHFQLLDKHFRCIQTMRSFTGVMPGEVRGCLGCHELQNTASNASVGRSKTGIALSKPPAKLTAPPWGARVSIGYERFVQPILDKYCGKCHQGDGKGRKKLDMTLRHSSARWGKWRSRNIPSPFKEPYLTLVGGRFGWNGKIKHDKYGLPGSISGCLVVEGYPERSPASLATLKPMTHLSYTSKLIHHAMSGEHNKVKIDAASLRRLIAWVDANGPFLGDEEIRKIPDPPFKTLEAIGVRPRLATAPNINRFNVRQDGDAIQAVKDAAETKP
ncbi:MAG: hypothetical protein QGG42_01100 [Phycisphaerae bacterium]|jgi:hypothetical protein|nr:hypothetical protein [Phycisphaerae bacterium]